MATELFAGLWSLYRQGKRTVNGWRARWQYRFCLWRGHKLGKEVYIGPRVSLGGKVTIGDCTTLVSDIRMQGGSILVGRNVIIAAHCTIMAFNHDYNRGNALPYGTDFVVREVVIEDNV